MGSCGFEIFTANSRQVRAIWLVVSRVYQRKTEHGRGGRYHERMGIPCQMARRGGENDQSSNSWTWERRGKARTKQGLYNSGMEFLFRKVKACHVE